MNFSVEEENLICMYHTSDRRRTMARMLAALPDMDTEMRRLANGTIAKLERMTDADFDGQRFDFTESVRPYVDDITHAYDHFCYELENFLLRRFVCTVGYRRLEHLTMLCWEHYKRLLLKFDNKFLLLNRLWQSVLLIPQ